LYILVGELKPFTFVSNLGQHAALKAPLTSRITRIVIKPCIVTRSHILCCCGTDISITYFELPSMQSALYLAYIFIIFSHYVKSRTISVKNLLSVKRGFDVLYKFCPKKFHF